MMSWMGICSETKFYFAVLALMVHLVDSVWLYRLFGSCLYAGHRSWISWSCHLVRVTFWVFLVVCI